MSPFISMTIDLMMILWNISYIGLYINIIQKFTKWMSSNSYIYSVSQLQKKIWSLWVVSNDLFALKWSKPWLHLHRMCWIVYYYSPRLHLSFYSKLLYVLLQQYPQAETTGPQLIILSKFWLQLLVRTSCRNWSTGCKLMPHYAFNSAFTMIGVVVYVMSWKWKQRTCEYWCDNYNQWVIVILLTFLCEVCNISHFIVLRYVCSSKCFLQWKPSGKQYFAIGLNVVCLVSAITRHATTLVIE